MEHWQDWNTGRAKDLGEVWVLRKGGRTARCSLQGHPIGIEARVALDGDVIATKAFRDQKAMLDETAAWREAYEAKGWRSTDGAEG